MSIFDLGIVRSIFYNIDLKQVEVVITPTYSGCPAMKIIEKDIKNALKSSGYENIDVKYQLHPPWTTDFINDDAKQKLIKYGIAPPEKRIRALGTGHSKFEKVKCPFCNSENTLLRSYFSSTACKELHFCNNCKQPFEKFKCH